MFRGQAIISKITTMHDRSVRVQLDTQEMNPELMADLFNLNSKFCNFALAPEDTKINQEDVPDIKPEFKGEKSSSQILRNRMFVYYREKNGTDQGFQTWYASALDEIGQKYLSKVD